MFNGSGWALFTLFVWELIEEGLESLIAYTISSVIAMFVVKALSTLAIITATQSIKVLVKNILYPYVKKLIYRKGGDKLEKLKQFISWIFANKKSLIGIVSGATATLSGTGVIDISTLPVLMVGGIDITPFIYYAILLVLTLIGVSGKGFESVEAFKTRQQVADAEKQEKKILKQAEKELAEEERLVNQSQAEKEKSEEKAQAEKEYRAKIEAKKAEILEAQKQDNTQ